jgi:hypothetical protein
MDRAPRQADGGSVVGALREVCGHHAAATEAGVDGAAAGQAEEQEVAVPAAAA